jgi:hypothetical protein
MTTERQILVWIRALTILVGIGVLVLAMALGFLLREYLAAKQIVTSAVSALTEVSPMIAGRLERAK